ncbi:MAG: winged helix-turn-helix domain-containing protein [Pirellulales bacterium]
MATAHAQNGCLDQIGDTAGLVWHHLNQHGPRTLSQLVKEVDAPRDVIMQAIGWLAREDKVSIEEDRNKKVVALR